MPTLKVLSYNIHKGFSFGIKRLTISKIRKSILDLQPDIIFLQEVIGENIIYRNKLKEWPIIPQFEFLAETYWPHFVYGKNAVYSNGDHGNAILSKYPIESFHNLNISTNRFEKRGLLHTRIRITDSFFINCYCVHLNILHRGRVRQLQRITEELVSRDGAFILAGDFNDWAQKASDFITAKTGAYEAFKQLHGTYALTFPSRLPVLKLDRIYLKELTPVHCLILNKNPWNELSDHAAIYSEIAYG